MKTIFKIENTPTTETKEATTFAVLMDSDEKNQMSSGSRVSWHTQSENFKSSFNRRSIYASTRTS